jgi:hypothetical protein
VAKVFYVREDFPSDRVVVGPETAIDGILKKFGARIQYVGRKIPVFEADKKAPIPSGAKYVLFRIESSYVSPAVPYACDNPGYYLIKDTRPEEFVKTIKGQE